MTLLPSSLEARCTVRVLNAQGLHARPCHAIASRALSYQSELRVVARGREINGKSILELMTLSAGPGTELELVARGPDAEALLCALRAVFEGCFGEDREPGR